MTTATTDLELLCRELYPQLVGLVSLHGASRAQSEDIAQDALTKAVQHWRRVSRMDNPAGWIVRVALNAAKSAGRRRTTEARALERLAHRPETGTGDAPEHAAERVEVVRALEQLPNRQREVVLLRFFLGFNVAETAQIMRCAEGTVKSNTHRALEQLRNGKLAASLEEH